MTTQPTKSNIGHDRCKRNDYKHSPDRLLCWFFNLSKCNKKTSGGIGNIVKPQIDRLEMAEARLGEEIPLVSYNLNPLSSNGYLQLCTTPTAHRPSSHDAKSINRPAIL